MFLNIHTKAAKVGTLFTSVALIASMAFTTSASASNLEGPPSSMSATCTDLKITLTHEDQEILNKIVSVSNHFEINDNQLSINLSQEQLKNDFGFSSQDYQFLENEVIAVANGNSVSNDYESEPAISTLANCGGWSLNYSDLTVGFATALVVTAEAGPAALAAAFTAISSMAGGPIGTVIGGGIALLGTGFFIDLAAKLIGAVAQGKGVCLTAKWGFPPLESKIM